MSYLELTSPILVDLLSFSSSFDPSVFTRRLPTMGLYGLTSAHVFNTFRCLANITSSFSECPLYCFSIHLFFGLPCVVVLVTRGPLLLITCTCWWQVYRTNRVKRWWLGTWRATRTICTSVSPATEFHRRPCVRSASQSNVSILYTMHHLIFPISQSVQSINQSINQQRWANYRTNCNLITNYKLLNEM